MKDNSPKKPSENELDDLKQELENFQREKERVRAILGQIGGVPKFHNTIFNLALVIATALCLTVSLATDELTVRLLMIELASAAVSAKIIYLIHCQMKVNHFKLWVLSSIEWRLNEIMKQIKKNNNPSTQRPNADV